MKRFKTKWQVLLILPVFLFLSACGGSSGGGGVSAGPFSVSPGSLAFTTTADGSAPANQTLTITPNTSTTVPDISASGSAIVTDPYAVGCLGDSTNLDCVGSSSGITVTVPVPDPITLGVGTFTGSILISSGGGSVTIPVTYTINPGTPAVSEVSPNVAVAGQTANVTIRGDGFGNFGSTAPTVTFGGVAGTNAKVISDSTMTVDLPATLAAGSQPVAVSGASVSFPSTASLDVVAKPTYAAAAIPVTAATGPDLRYIYDDARQAIYAVDAVNNTLDEYSYNSTSGWSTTPVTVVPIPSPNVIADAILSTDGSTLLVVANDNKVYKVDPATMSVTGSVAVSSLSGTSLDCSVDNCFDSMAISSDGRAFVLDNSSYSRYFYLYDPATDGVTGSYSLLAGYSQYVQGTLYGSRIGNRTVIKDPAFGYFVYNSITRSISNSGLNLTAPVAVSGDGKTIVSSTTVVRDNGTIYDATYGTLPVTPAAVALSLDGNTAYVLNTSGATPVLQVYDLSAGGTATQIGSDINLPADPGASPQMTMSIDDSYAFIGGASNLDIVPVP